MFNVLGLSSCFAYCVRFTVGLVGWGWLVSNLSRGFTVCLGFSLDCWVVSGLRVLVGGVLLYVIWLLICCFVLIWVCRIVVS